jgi:hypothetical protein
MWAVWALAPLVTGKIAKTGFKNPFYQVPGYTGSRVLEYGRVPGEPYLEFTWTQAMAVDKQNNVWVAEKSYHCICKIPPTSAYLDFPAYFDVFVGQWDLPGHYDGSAKVSRFNGPSGIAVSYDDQYLFVADTNNHCVRRISTVTGRTTTIAGVPDAPGLLDGKGVRAKLHFPISLGIAEKSGGGSQLLFVLDNVNRIRKLVVPDGDSTIADVYTLVDGACRAVSERKEMETIVMRTVGCHQDWLAQDTPESLQTWNYQRVCVGHSVTCGPRNHPGLADRYSPFLPKEEGAMSLGDDLPTNEDLMKTEEVEAEGEGEDEGEEGEEERRLYAGLPSRQQAAYQ